MTKIMHLYNKRYYFDTLIKDAAFFATYRIFQHLQTMRGYNLSYRIGGLIQLFDETEANIIIERDTFHYRTLARHTLHRIQTIHFPEPLCYMTYSESRPAAEGNPHRGQTQTFTVFFHNDRDAMAEVENSLGRALNVPTRRMNINTHISYVSTIFSDNYAYGWQEWL